jgi:hypothetical protein
MNRFFDPVRTRGMIDSTRWNTASDLIPLRETLLAVLGHSSEPLALVGEAITYEQLPPAEKARLKARRAVQHRQTDLHG